MCRSSNKAVHIFGCFYVEVDVYSMYYLLSKYTFDHLFFYFAAAISAYGVLYSCWVPGDVAILATANEDDLFEVSEVSCFT